MSKHIHFTIFVPNRLNAYSNYEFSGRLVGFPDLTFTAYVFEKIGDKRMISVSFINHFHAAVIIGKDKTYISRFNNIEGGVQPHCLPVYVCMMIHYLTMQVDKTDFSIYKKISCLQTYSNITFIPEEMSFFDLYQIEVFLDSFTQL